MLGPYAPPSRGAGMSGRLFDVSIRKFGTDLLTSLLEFTVESVPGAVGAGLSIAGDLTDGGSCGEGGEGGKSADGGDGATTPSAAPRSVAAVGVATELDPAQWSHAVGPVWEAFRSGRLTTASASGEGEASGALDEIGQLRPDAVRGVQGAVFLAGEWGGDLPVILSVYLDRTPDTKVLRQIDRYEPLVTQALAVVEYCAGEEQVAQQMLQMTQYRRVIEQAKGLVMGAVGGDANAAFAALARASQHFNIRLRNLAIALVEHVGGSDAEHPDDPDLVVRPSDSEREVAARVWAALTTTTAILPGDG